MEIRQRGICLPRWRCLFEEEQLAEGEDVTNDPYDQASRYLTQRDDKPMVGWLLGLKPGQFDFVQWLNTRHIPWPGNPERTCDTVAWLRDTARHGLPFAGVIEFQLRPDADMFGRMLIYLGAVYLETRPSDLPGDRFYLCAVVVNLTGKGNGSRVMTWRAADVAVVMRIKEWNLAELDASQILDGVAAGLIPQTVLAWIPLMHRGSEESIIKRWLELASAEPDAGRRADLGLVRVFAEAADCLDVWSKALEGWNVVESQVVNEWKGQARMAGKVETLVRQLQLRFGSVPEDVKKRIEETRKIDELNGWLDRVVTTQSLEHFRQETGI